MKSDLHFKALRFINVSEIPARFVHFTCLLLLLFGADFARAQGSAPTARFNPTTVMMSRFTFTVPPGWQWIETRSDVSNVVQSVTFQVNLSSEENCRAYFNHFIPGRSAGTRKSTGQRWKEDFLDATKTIAFKEEKIGKHQVFFMEINGTYKNERSKTPEVRHGFALYGAVLEDDGGNLVMRLMGPATAVEKARPAFRKMIEAAASAE